MSVAETATCFDSRKTMSGSWPKAPRPTTGGANWKTYQNDSFVGEMADLWGAASDDIWGVGTAGCIAHFDGKSWHEVTHQVIGSPFLRMFSAVHGSSAEEVWAVGHEMGANRNSALVFRYQAD